MIQPSSPETNKLKKQNTKRNGASDDKVRGFSLQRDPATGTLGLQADHRADWKPITADWLGREMLRRIAAGRKQLLARAVGLPGKANLSVVDLTGGLGRDAFTLAALGATVTLVERQPLLVELLRDAQTRARASDKPAIVEAADRIRIVGSNAMDFGHDQGAFDAAYVDPMYPHQGRRALPQKEMQLLRELAGDDADADQLLLHALSLAPRVAVKRPSKAAPIAELHPQAVISGTQARYDVYLRPRVKE